MPPSEMWQCARCYLQHPPLYHLLIRPGVGVSQRTIALRLMLFTSNSTGPSSHPITPDQSHEVYWTMVSEPGSGQRNHLRDRETSEVYDTMVQ